MTWSWLHTSVHSSPGLEDKATSRPNQSRAFKTRRVTRLAKSRARRDRVTWELRGAGLVTGCSWLRLPLGGKRERTSLDGQRLLDHKALVMGFVHVTD